MLSASYLFLRTKVFRLKPKNSHVAAKVNQFVLVVVFDLNQNIPTYTSYGVLLSIYMVMGMSKGFFSIYLRHCNKHKENNNSLAY